MTNKIAKNIISKINKKEQTIVDNDNVLKLVVK